MGNIYAYYLLTYACVFTYIRKKIYVLFVFPHGIRCCCAGNDKIFYLRAIRNVRECGMHFTYRPMAFTSTLKCVCVRISTKRKLYTHIKLLNFTPSRVSYHQIKSKATIHILFSFFFTIYLLHLISNFKVVRNRKNSDRFFFVRC